MPAPSLRNYKAKVDREVFRGLFRFSIQRNPYEKVVSYYFSPHRSRDGMMPEFTPEKFRGFIVARIRPIRHYISLSKATPLTRDIDYLMRYESLAEDFARVTRLLKLGDVPLGHRNQSKRTHYRDYYDSQTQALVEERFAEDIALGGYSF